MKRTRSAWFWLALAIATITLLVGAGIGAFLLVRSSKVPPLTIDIVADYPGSSAEEIERTLTIPLEVAFAGMSGLQRTRSQSSFGRAHVRLQFTTDIDPTAARDQVIERLGNAQLPQGITPFLRRAGTLVCRFRLRGPKDNKDADIFRGADLRALADWTLCKHLLRVPGVAGVDISGSAAKRYEVHPDAERLRKFGIELTRLRQAIARANGPVDMPGIDVPGFMRGIGFLGGGRDPMVHAMTLNDAGAAAAFLRGEEDRRLAELRAIEIASVNGVGIRVDDLVDGGPLRMNEPSKRGVIVGVEPWKTKVGLSRFKTDGRGGGVWEDEGDVVLGSVHARRTSDLREARRDVLTKLKEFNEVPGTLLPGVQIEMFPRTPLNGAPEPAVVRLQGRFAGTSPEKFARNASSARRLLRERQEIVELLSRIGEPDEDLDPVGDTPLVEILAVLKPTSTWATPAGRVGPLTMDELARDILSDLRKNVAGSEWEIVAADHDSFLEPFMPRAGETMLKITGPDLDQLHKHAAAISEILKATPGTDKVKVLTFGNSLAPDVSVDREQCARLGIKVADVFDMLALAMEGTKVTDMKEGEKSFAVTLCWPKELRADGLDLKRVPVLLEPPVRLGDVAKIEVGGGKSTIICREEGQRLVAVRFRATDRSAGDILSEVKGKVAAVIQNPYRVDSFSR